MKCFLVRVHVPYIGEGDETAWDTNFKVGVVACASEEEAVELMKLHLPKEDPEVKEALLKQDRRTEYFDIKVHELEGNRGIFLIPRDLLPRTT